MNKKLFTARKEFKQKILILYILLIVLFSCVGQNKSIYIPEPDFSVYEKEKKIEIGNIIEIKNGASIRRGLALEEALPVWLQAFIKEGVEETEKIESLKDKYVFIAYNKGGNFTALNKWAENFTAEQNFAILAAIRIEERLINNATLFPDDEYGNFFETLVKNAYNTEYSPAVKEEIYWFRSSPPDTYNFFILLTINKIEMQSIIGRMMIQSYNTEKLTHAQTVSVLKLRQSFFEGF